MAPFLLYEHVTLDSQYKIFQKDNTCSRDRNSFSYQEFFLKMNREQDNVTRKGHLPFSEPPNVLKQKAGGKNTGMQLSFTQVSSSSSLPNSHAHYAPCICQSTIWSGKRAVFTAFKAKQQAFLWLAVPKNFFHYLFFLILVLLQSRNMCRT